MLSVDTLIHLYHAWLIRASLTEETPSRRFEQHTDFPMLFQSVSEFVSCRFIAG